MDGVDPDMGARPMARAIQEDIEQKIAEKIIAGKLTQGTTLEFTQEDFPQLQSLKTPSEPLSALDQALFGMPEDSK